MGKKENFTAERVAKFDCQPGKKQSIFWDGKVPGLGLRVTSGGAKSYIFETRLHNKTLRITIGDVRTWTIGKAQSEATNLKTLTDKGIDPRQQRADQAAAANAIRANEKRKDVTVGEAWQAYVAARKHMWGDSHRLDHEVAVKAGGEKRGRGRRANQGAITYPGLIYPLLTLKLADLTADRVQDWITTSNLRGKTETAKCFRLLRAFLNWCAERKEYEGITNASAHAKREVRDLVQKAKAKKLSLQREQLPLWFESVGKISNSMIAAYLQGLLLTGARRNELTGLRWDDVDFQWGSLTIRDKVEGERTIPLTPYFASLLRELQRINNAPPTVRRLNTLKKDGKTWKPSQWVFSSPTSATGRLADPLTPLQKAMSAAGLPLFSPHDLRRSFDTLSEWVEVPTGVVAQIMGHKPSATAEKHYKNRPLDLLRMWHCRIETWMLQEAGIAMPVPREESPLHLAKSS